MVTFSHIMSLGHLIAAKTNNDELSIKLFDRFKDRKGLQEFLDAPQPEPVSANGKLEFVLHYAIVAQLEKVDAATSDLVFMQEDYMLQQLCETYVDMFGTLPADVMEALQG